LLLTPRLGIDVWADPLVQSRPGAHDWCLEKVDQRNGHLCSLYCITLSDAKYILLYVASDVSIYLSRRSHAPVVKRYSFGGNR